MLRAVKELFQYQSLVRHLVMTELKVRYRASVFGFLWTLLNPLLLMLVLWSVFSRIGRIHEDNYALFLLSALMMWIFFQQSIDAGQSSIVKNKGLMQKIYLPKLVFPMTVVGSNLVNFAFFLIAYFLIALFTPVGFKPTAPLIVPVVVMAFFLAFGGALLMATLNVFFRDFSHLTSVMLRALFYLTPIIYPASLLGPKAEMYLRFNPVYYPTVAARDVLYYGLVPSADIWLLGFAFAFGAFFVGLWSFSISQHKFIYYA